MAQGELTQQSHDPPHLQAAPTEDHLLGLQDHSQTLWKMQEQCRVKLYGMLKSAVTKCNLYFLVNYSLLQKQWGSANL